MEKFNNQIVGLVRFSYPSLSGFEHKIEDGQKAEAMLYDPVRLERRFHLFEKLCLPSLLAQTDRDFTCLFLVGQNMPEQAKNRLAAAIAPLSDARIHAELPLPHYLAQKNTFATVSTSDMTHRTTFRLDDDDAVDVNYIARLRQTSANLRPFCGDTSPVAIAFNHGFYVSLSKLGNTIFDSVEKLPSVGVALLATSGFKDNIYRRNHRLLPQFVNTYSDAVTPGFIRSIHQDNDSNPTIIGQRDVLDKDEIRRRISDNFAVSIADLMAL